MSGTRKPPRNVQRIDHVVFIVRPEHADEAAARFEEVLGITFTDRFEPEGVGIRVYIDWGSGVEVVTPIDPTVAKEYAEYLDTHGEGLFRLVFGVADLEATLERVQGLGVEVHARYDVLSQRPEWKSIFNRLDESIIDPIYGGRLNLAQVEPRDDD